MSNRIALRAGSLALSSAFALSSFAPVADEALKPADHKEIGKAIAKYVVARNKTKDIDKMAEGVAKELENVKKKLKGGEDPLSLTADLGKALWESFSYSTQKGQVKGKVAIGSVDKTYIGEKSKLDYAIYAPARYVNTQAYPLLLCIPEKGAKLQDHLTEKWVLPEIRENAILVAIPMPDDLAQWTETGSEGKAGGIGNTLTVFGDVSRTYAIDFDRVYLCGRGEGVATAVAIAGRYLDRFAGVVGRSGDVGETTTVDNFKNLPTFFAGAGAGATAFHEKIEKAEYKNCTIAPEADEAAVWKWIQEHPRVSNPTDIVLVPGNPIPFRAYWLEVPPLDAQARVVAKADRASNTITIDAEGAPSVTLYFNDVLVDMGKPIKVLINGTEHVDLVPRNLPQLLNLMYVGRCDPGKVYTATKSYDGPAKPKPK